MSLGVNFNTSPILIPPRAINSSIKRLRIIVVRKMISSIVSFSIKSQYGGVGARNNCLSIGESHGFLKSETRLFLIKLKKADRWAYRILLVLDFLPTVIRFKKESMSSVDSSFNIRLSNSRQNLNRIDSYARTVFFFGMSFMIT